MKKINVIFKYGCLFFLSIHLLGCQTDISKSEHCLKFANEIYDEKIPDTSQVKEVLEIHKRMLERFGEKSEKGANDEVYHLQFHSSHGYGKSVKFKNANGACSIAVKCINNEECKAYETKIDITDWDRLENMIYEFDFWTEEDIRANRDALDGWVCVLEGNRPRAKECHKKVYKLITRGSIRYDKVGALCEYIFEYEETLRFKYEQMSEIN